MRNVWTSAIGVFVCRNEASSNSTVECLQITIVCQTVYIHALFTVVEYSDTFVPQRDYSFLSCIANDMILIDLFQLLSS